MPGRRMAIILSFLFILFGDFVPCFAAQPQRVAILPVYFHSIQSDESVGRVIEQTLAARFRTPLASIVPVYDVIALGEVAPVLPTAPPGGKQKVKLDRSILATIAEKLNADIVIAAEVTQYYTETIITDEDIYRRIYFQIRLRSYHKPSDMFYEGEDHRYYFGSDSPVVQPDYLAKYLTEALLAKVPDYRGGQMSK